jgi:hypothetical protein
MYVLAIGTFTVWYICTTIHQTWHSSFFHMLNSTEVEFDINGDLYKVMSGDPMVLPGK